MYSEYCTCLGPISRAFLPSAFCFSIDSWVGEPVQRGWNVKKKKKFLKETSSEKLKTRELLVGGGFDRSIKITFILLKVVQVLKRVCL